MILSFKQEFPWGEETNFIPKILNSAGDRNVWFYEEEGTGKSIYYEPKIHSIRDHQRFKPGALLHMAIGVRSKKYMQFNRGIPNLNICKSVQRFDLSYRDRNHVALYIDANLMYLKKPKKEQGLDFLNKFAVNDGFTDADQFFKWFNKTYRKASIIHWTDKIYIPSDSDATL